MNELKSVQEIKDFAKSSWDSYTHNNSKSATWANNSGKFTDIDGLDFFHHTSFANGILEPPVKGNLCIPTIGRSFFRASLKNFITQGGLKTKSLAEFQVFSGIGIKFPEYSENYADLYYNFEGSCYNANLRVFAMQLANIRPYIGRGEVVCEIGGGYGGFAELFTVNSKPSAYIIIDLFETLCASMAYLKSRGMTVFFAESASDMEEPPKNAVTFLASQDKNFAKNTNIGLFVNSSSMMEMPSFEVHAYFDIIQAHGKTKFYNSNCVAREEKGGICSYSNFPYDDKWKTVFSFDTGNNRETLKIRGQPAPSAAGRSETSAGRRGLRTSRRS